MRSFYKQFHRLCTLGIFWGVANASPTFAQQSPSMPIDEMGKRTSDRGRTDGSKDTTRAQVRSGSNATDSKLGPVPGIKGDDLVGIPAPNLLTLLMGRFPGLFISQSTGSPGTDGDGQQLNGAFNASIRGYSGRTAGGGQELIVLIDGAPRPYSSIAPEEIGSITLLKDAISTVAYGYRSTPGMISITTKNGKDGALQMSFTGQLGFQRPLSFPKPLAAYEYATLYNQTQINSGVAPANVKYSAAALAAYQNGSDPYLYPNVNWRDVVLKDQVPLYKGNFNLSGSGSGVNYFVSLDYLRSDGLFKTAAFNNYNTSPDYARYSLRSNVGVNFNRSLHLDFGLYGRFEDTTQPGNNDAQGILNAVFSVPALAYPINNPNGTLGGNAVYGQNNIYARTVQAGYNLGNTKTISFDLALTQRLDKFVEGLYLRGSGNVNIQNGYGVNRSKTYAVVPISAAVSGTDYTYGTAIGTTTDIPNPGTGGPSFRQTTAYYEAMAGYEHAVGSHNIDVKLIANRQTSTRNEDLPYIYNTFSGSAAYDLKGRYFAEVAGSYGSFNQFAPGKKYEPFYAVAIGWDLAKEQFLSNKASWFNTFKLRGNYGKTGYVNRGSYGYFSYIQRYGNTGTYYYFGATPTGTEGYAEAGLGNINASGEKAKKLDVGLDIGLFQDRLTFSIDHFKNRLYDIWITPSAFYQVLGINSPAQNLGKQDYFGTEYTAGYNGKAGKVNYFVNLNLSSVKSKLVYGAEVVQENAYQMVTGLPVGIRTGYTAVGLFRSQSEIDASAVPNFGGILRTNIRPGDIKYLDRNNDGIIDNRDLGPVGSTRPLIFYGANFGLSLKGFDLNILLQGALNRQVYLDGDYEWAFRNNGNNTAFQQNLDAYTSSNPQGEYPRLTIGANPNNELSSTFWLHDANFIRLKSAELGYTLTGKWAAKIRVRSLRVFASGLNLYTLTNLNDFGVKMDPEVSGASYPLFRTFNFGVTVKL